MNAWKTLSSEVKYENPWIKVIESRVITPKGSEGKYTVVETNPFVVIVALQDDKLIMVNQFRYTIQKKTLEFPAGGADTGEDLINAAKRELKEETGFEAADWTELGYFDDAVGIARHRGYVFLAQNLTQTNENNMGDDGIENFTYVRIDDLTKLVAKNEITDPKVIAALFKTKLALISPRL